MLLHYLVFAIPDSLSTEHLQAASKAWKQFNCFNVGFYATWLAAFKCDKLCATSLT